MSKLRTNIKPKLPPVTPGEVLADILAEAGVAANSAAIAMGIPANRVTGIVNGQRAITADTAMRRARYFGTTPQVWMNLQTNYELELARGDADRGVMGQPQQPAPLRTPRQ